MSAGEQLSAGNLTDNTTATQGVVEQHHVEAIPESDRHGRPRDQFTLWFAANANVVNFTLGVLAIEFGLNLFWALFAIVIGNVLGMLLTALHAWQGPRLGVPQMIQSRGQFGFYGGELHPARVDRAGRRVPGRVPGAAGRLAEPPGVQHQRAGLDHHHHAARGRPGHLRLPLDPPGAARSSWPPSAGRPCGSPAS
jgi:hypothetical protein